MKPLRIAALIALCAASACAHAVGRMADLQVQDRATGRNLAVYWHGGRAYVVGAPGAEYRIVLHNRRGEDLLAVVSVDGVNVLSGEDASASQGGYVLTPWRRVPVDGWRKSLGEVAAFYFTSLGDSYAARTGRPDNVGVIGVALFQRAAPPRPSWNDIAPESRDEASANLGAKRVAPAAAAPLATGHGRREDAPARYVDFERATSYPVETITLYYDSRPHLVAQGIIPAAPACGRDPNPFPSRFVPDPS